MLTVTFIANQAPPVVGQIGLYCKQMLFGIFLVGLIAAARSAAVEKIKFSTAGFDMVFGRIAVIWYALPQFFGGNGF